MASMDGNNGEAGAPHGAAADAAPYRLVLGFERIGLIALKTPIFSAIVAALLCLVAAFGVGKLKVDDSLSTLFRSNSAEFRHFEEFSKRFPSNEYDVLMVVDGSSLLSRDSIEKLRDLVTDLQLIEGTRGVLSLFSARQPPENGQLPGPLFPADLPEGPEYDALIQKALTNEIIRGKLLAEDGKLALIVIALDPAVANGEGDAKVVTAIRKAAAEDLDGAGLKVELTGVPVMRLEIRNAVERDEMLYNSIGFAAGCPDCNRVLPAYFLHDRCGGAALDRDPAGAWHAGLARFQAQYLPECDDPAHYGHQLLGQHAAYLRGAR